MLEQLYIPSVKEGHGVSSVLSSLDPLLANISQLGKFYSSSHH
jgi:hypothetical protein